MSAVASPLPRAALAEQVQDLTAAMLAEEG